MENTAKAIQPTTNRRWFRTGRSAATLKVTTNVNEALDWLLNFNRKVEVLNELGQVLEVWG